MKKTIFIIAILILIVLLIFSIFILIKINSAPHTDLEKAAYYLKQKGIKIIAVDDNIPGYILTDKQLADMQFMHYSGLEHIDAKKYLNKRIETYNFTAKYHPIDSSKGTYEQAIVSVIICENSVIGGYIGEKGGVVPLF